MLSEFQRSDDASFTFESQMSDDMSSNFKFQALLSTSVTSDTDIGDCLSSCANRKFKVLFFDPELV